MVPKVGQDIYVPNRPGMTGGLGRVIEIEVDLGAMLQPMHYVRVAEHPGRLYGWTGELANLQCSLKKQFHHCRAHANGNPPPDDVADRKPKQE